MKPIFIPSMGPGVVAGMSLTMSLSQCIIIFVFANNLRERWVQFATNISVTAGLSKTSFTKLIGGAFAESSHKNTSGFSLQAIFVHGILDTLPGALITMCVAPL